MMDNKFLQNVPELFGEAEVTRNAFIISLRAV
jgi:hypothetical protein